MFDGIARRARGFVWSKQTARYLVRQRRPWLVPGLFVKSGFKYLGYRMGKCYRLLPRPLVVRCSMNKEYWKKAGAKA